MLCDGTSVEELHVVYNQLYACKLTSAFLAYFPILLLWGAFSYALFRNACGKQLRNRVH